MNTLKEKWEKTLEYLKPELTPVSYDTWMSPLKPISLDEENGKLYLQVYNDFSRSILETRYVSIVENSLKQAFGFPLKVVFVETDDIIHAGAVPKEVVVNAFTDEYYLNPKYIFNTFVVGFNNRFAHAASLAVAEKPAKKYNPLFIYGAAGLGKTHLMHAIGHYILQQNPKAKVLYVSSEMFTNELIKAIREDKNIEFRNKYRQIDVLLIDDIQFIEKKERTQEEFFHTFNTLYEANKQIIVSSDRTPKDLVILDERLRSRFEWGLIADIQAPDYETRVAILIKKAELEDLEISNNLLEIIEFVAEKITSNVRELEGALIRVIAYASLTNQKMDKDLAKNVLKDIISSNNKNITPKLIKETVCKHFNIKMVDIESAKRSRNLSFPRQIAMFICRDLTDLSLPKIGDAFGNRDHTTVLHGIDKITKEIVTNSTLKDIINSLTNDIKAG